MKSLLVTRADGGGWLGSLGPERLAMRARLRMLKCAHSERDRIARTGVAMRKNGMWIYAFIMAACADSRLRLAPHGASPPCRAHDLAPARFVGVLFDKGDLEKSWESLLRLRRGTTCRERPYGSSSVSQYK